MKTSKKIGIDCRMLKESGIGRYIENLILNLNQFETNDKYILLVQDSKNFPLKLNQNFELVDANFSWHGLEEQFGFLNLLNSLDLDLFHSPHPNMPYFYNKPFVITIHDLTMLHEKTGRASTYIYPIYFLKWLVFKLMLSWAVRKAKSIITVSEFVKKQIINEFKVPESKVAVIYNGVSDSIHKVDEEGALEKVKEKLNISKPFLFYLGNAYPHKNLENLIIAFELLNKENLLQLVLAGKEDYFYHRLKESYGNLKNVIFAGFITDEEASALYSSCEAFVYPSISEGFGIQIIEALKVGSKVICSNNTSFPEIAQKYAFYFNPLDTEDIKTGIANSLKLPNKNHRAELLNFLDRYSWKISAQKHYEIYQEN